MAAPMNADTIDPILYTAKIIAKLSPINAANPCNTSCAPVLPIPALRRMGVKKINARGAKIVTHFIKPVKKNAINAGLVLTKNETTILTMIASVMWLYTLSIELLISDAVLYPRDVLMNMIFPFFGKVRGLCPLTLDNINILYRSWFDRLASHHLLIKYHCYLLYGLLSRLREYQ